MNFSCTWISLANVLWHSPFGRSAVYRNIFKGVEIEMLCTETKMSFLKGWRLFRSFEILRFERLKFGDFCNCQKWNSIKILFSVLWRKLIICAKFQSHTDPISVPITQISLKWHLSTFSTLVFNCLWHQIYRVEAVRLIMILVGIKIWGNFIKNIFCHFVNI